MNLSDENTKTTKAGKTSSIIVFLLLFAAILGIAFYMYLRSQNIDLRNVSINELLKNNFLVQNQQNVENVSEIPYDPKEHPVFCTFNNLIIKCTKDSIRGFNAKGEEQWIIPVSLNNPILKASGSYMLVADLNGKDIYVINGKDVKWSKKIDNNIVNADISECGYVSAVQEAKGYKAAVSVYNLQGMEFFTRSIAENYVLGAKVSPTGKQVIINSIDASGASANASLEFTDIMGMPLAGKIPKNNVIFPSIWYLNDGSVLAAGDSMLMCLDKDRNEKWKQDFGGRKVFSSNISLGKYAVAAVSGEDKPSTFGKHTTGVRIYNPNGQQAAVYTIEDDIKDIETCSDLIAANTGREVYFVNTRGKYIGKYTSKTDIIGVYFLNKKEAAIVTKESVIVTEI